MKNLKLKEITYIHITSEFFAWCRDNIYYVHGYI